ncbi:TIGR01212 family radical SAM protein [Odoribacter sp. OttesenSCG-928-J03]|nr:TIGR01212 family radical SAM protein [Odoribacter sp. OttesenSCG-928-J03]MDL2330881.1 TIGR01212 family radical SAM protein [Odoribacter sp. OttesenSCG-928-A06]
MNKVHMEFWQGKRYKDTPDFFRAVFGERVQKLSIDAGFSCPNRDGTKGTGGCIFCNNDSFSPDYCRSVEGITQQLEAGIRFFDAKYKGQKYLAYFQTYSNTYAPLDVLKRRYEEALNFPGVVGLVIGTRPDAINEEVLDYLEELAKKYYICVEYGVESVNDAVLQRINRGHDFATARETILKTAGRGIHIGAHLIFGLPGESEESMLQGAIVLSDLPINILKLHQLQIIKGTQLAEEYREAPDRFRLYTMEEYLDFVVKVIENMNPEVYLERFVNQAPAEYLIAPKWGVKNFEFVAKLDKKLKELETWQGKRRP